MFKEPEHSRARRDPTPLPCQDFNSPTTSPASVPTAPVRTLLLTGNSALLGRLPSSDSFAFAKTIPLAELRSASLLSFLHSFLPPVPLYTSLECHLCV